MNQMAKHYTSLDSSSQSRSVRCSSDCTNNTSRQVVYRPFQDQKCLGQLSHRFYSFEEAAGI